MNHFMSGFVDELVKVGAFAQEATRSSYNSGPAMNEVMSQTQGANARKGLKSGAPVPTEPAPENTAASPITTPMHMLNYSVS